jgi:hypothetical protein
MVEDLFNLIVLASAQVRLVNVEIVQLGRLCSLLDERHEKRI